MRRLQRWYRFPGIKFLKPRLSQRTIFRALVQRGTGVLNSVPTPKGASEFNALCAKLYLVL